jgi:hypothetical protein
MTREQIFSMKMNKINNFEELVLSILVDYKSFQELCKQDENEFSKMVKFIEFINKYSEKYKEIIEIIKG